MNDHAALSLDTLSQIKDALSGCSLSVSWWGVARACAGSEHAVAATALGAKRRAIRARKYLIDTTHPAWVGVTRVRSQARAWFEEQTLPYVLPGCRLFRKDMRATIWSGVAQYQGRLRAAARLLDDRRDEVLDGARDLLGDMFDGSLYPASWEALLAFELREHSIEPPSYLRHTNAEEYDQQLRRTLEDVGAGLARFEAQMMEQAGEAARALAANLAGDSAANVAARSANLDKFSKVFGRVAQMRFEGTAVFRAALAEARDVIDGVTPQELRASRGLRQETRSRLEALLGRYAALQERAGAKHRAEAEAQTA